MRCASSAQRMVLFRPACFAVVHQLAPLRPRCEVFCVRRHVQVGLDWLEPESAPDDAPVLLCLHTLTGTAREFTPVAAEAARRGWRAVVLLRRGHLGKPLASPRVNLLGRAADTRAQVAAVSARFPRAPLLALGASAGTGALVRYLGEAGANSPITAALALCPGYDCGPGKAFERFHPLLDRFVLGLVKRFFLRRSNHGVLAQLKSLPGLRAARSLGEFQRRAFELEGYDSVAEMYEGTNPLAVAAQSRTLLLCLSARDDPVCSHENLVESEWLFEEAATSSVLCLTERGSHVAYYEGLLVPQERQWSDRVAWEFFDAALALRAEGALRAPAEMTTASCAPASSSRVAEGAGGGGGEKEAGAAEAPAGWAPSS